MGTMSAGRARIAALVLMVCGVTVAFALLGVQSGRVQAQEAVATPAVTPVAVLDFVNRSAFGGDLLARSAADALVLAMDESRHFEPLPRSEVEQAVARLGFSMPMNRPAQGRLATVLEVPYVATGTINDVYFQYGRDGRVAVVDITVTLLAANSGEYVNGARVKRTSTPKPGYSGDEMAIAEEALTLATYEAVATMISYTYPEATILNATPTDVYLNEGSRSGLKDGMELVVMRFGEKVGRVRITEVEPTKASAAIIANYRGIAPGDLALPIFEAPTTAQAVAARAPRTRTRLNNALLGIAAAAGIFLTMRHESPADVAVSGVAASSLSDPSGSRAGILVTWSPPTHEWRHVLLYEIYRNDSVVWVQPGPGSGVSGTGTFFIDEIGFEEQQYEVTLTINDVSGAFEDYEFTEVEDQTAGGGPIGTEYDRIWDYSPLFSGGTYIYRVVAVVAALTLQRLYILDSSPIGSAPGLATAIFPPPLLAPAPDAAVADPAEVQFSWMAVAGPTEYVLQISRQPQFEFASTKTYVVHEGTATAGTTLSTVMNVAQDFPPAPGGGLTVLYWRIGCRNARDLLAPRTDPAIAQALPQDQGYVWSMPGLRAFTISSSSAAATAAGAGDHRAPRALRLLGVRP